MMLMFAVYLVQMTTIFGWSLLAGGTFLLLKQLFDTYIVGKKAVPFITKFPISKLEGSTFEVTEPFSVTDKYNKEFNFHKGDTFTVASAWVSTDMLQIKNTRQSSFFITYTNLCKCTNVFLDLNIPSNVNNPLSKPKYTLGIVLLCIGILMPNTQTAKYMAGAYILQAAATSEFAKEVGNKVYTLALKQVDKWSEEVPELKELTK